MTTTTDVTTSQPMAYFHGRSDETVLDIAPFDARERELSYRLTLHQHPYVGALLQKLLSAGVPSLQATDTDYDPGKTLPGSVEVSLDAAAALPVPAGTRLLLSADATVAVSGGDVTLSAGAQVRAADVAPEPTVTVLAGTQLTLLGDVPDLPGIGTVFTVNGAHRSVLVADTPGQLVAKTSVMLRSGKSGTLPAGTAVVLRAQADTSVADGAQARLLKRQWRPRELFEELFTATRYQPTKLVRRPYPVKDLDFSSGGAYAPYNWELFFHVPLTIAMNLSKNQRFAEAQRWFHYLFDPTDNSEGPSPERYWKVRPLQFADATKIEQILVNLATGADRELADETVNSIARWEETPFRPHAVARYRHQAYMYKTVMAYVDNLIAWGDSLFAQDVGEAVDEAETKYVLAADILGPKPLPVPAKGSMRPQTYDNLRKDLKQFGTVVRDVESEGAFDLGPLPADSHGDGAGLATVRGLSKALYFSVPRNDKLLGYWDTVADRLFKIQNSLNLAGTFRRLATFDPPIDPALMARAAASGLDVAAIVTGLNQPLPLVRFTLLAQKAAELAQEVKSLGGTLLAALEKEDNEALGILRAKHERVLLELGEQVKYGQVQEAVKAGEGLEASLALALQRYTYYELQLGTGPDKIAAAIPKLAELDADGLEKMRLAAQEPALEPRPVQVDIARNLGASGGHPMSKHEALELARLERAQTKTEIAAVVESIGGFLALIPEFSAHVEPLGVGVSVSVGGTNLSAFERFAAGVLRSMAEHDTYVAANAAKIGSYARREQDWTFQSNAAAGDITQIFKQIRAAQIREAVATMELANHRTQIEQSRTIERFLNEDGTDRTGKLTNKALYSWMKREVRGLHAQCFQLAFDMARKAERALGHELGDPSLRFVQASYLAGKDGLLAGEKLYLDIRRMELAYLELNSREHELIKHVSLQQLDPLVLLQLRSTGRCTVRVPEAVFDLDGAGHYFRRIKTMAVSVPCVAGPYVGVNLTLTLLKSSIRKSPVVGKQYARADGDDSRFEDYYGSTQSVVASSAQNDSGLFDAGLRDERYLPFEYSGVVSEWQLELPADPNKDQPAQFDYDTISDVILHFRYTARGGGELLHDEALKAINAGIKDATMAGCLRLFSARYDFPAEWAAFRRDVAAGQRHGLTLTLRPEHYPFWAQNHLTDVKRVDLLARSAKKETPANLTVFASAVRPALAGDEPQDVLVRDEARGNLLAGNMDNIALPKSPTGALTLYFDDAELDDFWMALTWSG